MDLAGGWVSMTKLRSQHLFLLWFFQNESIICRRWHSEFVIILLSSATSSRKVGIVVDNCRLSFVIVKLVTIIIDLITICRQHWTSTHLAHCGLVFGLHNSVKILVLEEVLAWFMPSGSSTSGIGLLHPPFFLFIELGHLSTTGSFYLTSSLNAVFPLLVNLSDLFLGFLSTTL
jgi:hypothetical protein